MTPDAPHPAAVDPRTIATEALDDAYIRLGKPPREWRHVPQFPSILTSSDGHWRRIRYNAGWDKWFVIGGSDVPEHCFALARMYCGLEPRQQMLESEGPDGEMRPPRPVLTPRESALRAAKERRTEEAYLRKLERYKQKVEAREAWIAAGKATRGRPPRKPEPPNPLTHCRGSLIINFAEQEQARYHFSHVCANLPPTWRARDIHSEYKGSRLVGNYTLTIARAVALAWCLDQLDTRVPIECCQVQLPPDFRPEDYPEARFLSWRYTKAAWRHCPELVQLPPPQYAHRVGPAPKVREKRRVAHASKEEIERLHASIDATAAKLDVPVDRCLAFLPEIMRHFKSTDAYKEWYNRGYAHRNTAWARYHAQRYADPTFETKRREAELGYRPGELRVVMAACHQVIEEMRNECRTPDDPTNNHGIDRGSILMRHFQRRILVVFREHPYIRAIYPNKKNPRSQRWIYHYCHLYAYDGKALDRLDPHPNNVARAQPATPAAPDTPKRIKRSKRTHPPQSPPKTLPPHLADPNPCEF